MSPAPMRKPGARVRRGLTAISSEMEAVADCKRDEGADGRREADDIRAALDYIRRAIARAAGAD